MDEDILRFFDLSIDLQCIAGTDGYFKRINPAFEKTLGYSEAELLGRPFIYFIHPDDISPTLAELNKLSSGNPTLSFENRYCCKDGSYKWLSWTAHPVDKIIFAIARDVTEQKRLNLALQESEKLFRSTLETASVAIIAANGSGQISLSNLMAEEIFGYNRGELIGASIDLLLPDRFRALHSRYRNEYFANLEIRPMGLGIDLVGQRKDGTEFPIEVGLSYFEMSDGLLVLAFIADISERHHLEAERIKLTDELQAFAHTVAHDLKSPLSVIIGNSSLLNIDYDDLPEDDIRECLQDIETTSRKMKEIIDELLLLSNVRSKEDFERGRLDMRSIVSKAQEQVAALIKDYDAEISLPTNWPISYGYAPWVEQIWVNYLSNGIKYGGVPPRLDLGASVQDDGMVRYWIRDNGKGLKPEEQARMFIPFTRLKESFTQGHGLGLSIVKRIADKLDGQVGVESEYGNGSTFYFTLPLAN
jgi:PAS domain S-box-containing protein